MELRLSFFTGKVLSFAKYFIYLYYFFLLNKTRYFGHFFEKVAYFVFLRDDWMSAMASCASILATNSFLLSHPSQCLATPSKLLITHPSAQPQIALIQPPIRLI
jgi:hypothetical protein